MQNKHNKRICIVANSLGGGGLEKMAALQSQYLSDSGYEIFIVSILDQINYNYKGKLLNLGAYKNKSNSIINRLSRFKRLYDFIRKNQIDIIIDHRLRKRWLSEWLISNILYRLPTIYTIHSYDTTKYIPTTNSFLNKKYQHSLKLVAVSKAINLKLLNDYGFNNCMTIYNPIQSVESSSFAPHETHQEPYVLWYGRLKESEKNITLLIDAYKRSQLPDRNIKLFILGNGPDEKSLKDYVTRENLNECVSFYAFKENPYSFIANALFVLLTSRFEGFPMVIPEALNCNVPVISVDCTSGPSEIIQHGYNGLLVENNNHAELSNAMNEFINNSSLYEYCKSNAKMSVSHLKVSVIKKQWIELIENGIQKN